MMLNATWMADGKVDYLRGLDKQALNGVRVGVLRFAKIGHATAPLKIYSIRRFQKWKPPVPLSKLKTGLRCQSGSGKMSSDLLKYEFKAGLNAYLAIY